MCFFFFSSRRRHTRLVRDWSSDVCSSDLDTKHKKYPLWRLDIILSKTKYSSIHYVENGGWHFTNIKSPEEIEKKFSNFLHHQDFEDSGLTLDNVKEMVKNKKVLYDHSVDQKDYKWSGKTTLKKKIGRAHV